MRADQVTVIQIAALWAALVGTAGAVVLRLVRSLSLAVSVVVVALVGVGAVVAGAVATARAMFLSSHDFSVLLLVVLVSGTVALAAALLLGRVVVRRSKDVARAAAGLASGSYVAVEHVLPRELALVDRVLADAGQQLGAARERERALADSRRHLVAGMSHDLRTPLAGIRAMAEALEDGVVTSDDDVRRYHAGLRREADRMTAMVGDLFEVARLDAHALDLVLRPLDVADLVSDAVSSAAPLARSAGVQLKGHVASGLPPVLASDAELGRVLTNLLGNALRHTGSGGVVRLDARAVDGAVLLEVYDACGGIDAGDLPRVFELGYRGSAARTPDDSSGAGLGLTIVRGLVEAQAGTVDVRNTEGGCCFGVRLPAAQPTQTEAAPAGTSPGRRPLASGST